MHIELNWLQNQKGWTNNTGEWMQLTMVEIYVLF